MADKNTIKLMKYLDVIVEKKAHATITPGMLLELYSTDGEVRAHSHLHGNAIPIFALEDELQGKSIDDVYVAGDRVQCWVAQRGEQVYAIMADAEEIAVGDYLVSHGDGTLKKYDASGASDEGHVMKVVAVALEALDWDGSSNIPTNSGGRIKVMVA